MEVIIYQIVIAVIILVAGGFGKKPRNVTTFIICLFTVVEVFTFKLAILQFITIFLAYAFSSGYEEKKDEAKKEEFNYYVVDEKEKEKSGNSSIRFSTVFIIIISIFSTIYIFQKRNELKKEHIEIKNDPLIYKKDNQIYKPVIDTMVNDASFDRNVANVINEENYFSNDDNLLEYGKDVNSNIEYCIHNDLSYKYEYALVVKRYINNEIEKILIQIKNKATSETIIKHISLINRFGDKSQFYDKTFTNCNFVRSFITGFNMSKEIVDGDFGDFIVCDFNFDGNEDFVVKIDKGGNGGAVYRYYFMDENGEYNIDTFLTNEVGYFPSELDFANKTITTDIHAGACGYNESVYKYISETKRWITIKSEYINICE